jgi:hypothetical protein
MGESEKLSREISWVYVKKMISLLKIMLSFYTIELTRIIPCWRNNIFLNCTLRIILQELQSVY